MRAVNSDPTRWKSSKTGCVIEVPSSLIPSESQGLSLSTDRPAAVWRTSVTGVRPAYKLIASSRQLFPELFSPTNKFSRPNLGSVISRKSLNPETCSDSIIEANSLARSGGWLQHADGTDLPTPAANCIGWAIRSAKRSAHHFTAAIYRQPPITDKCRSRIRHGVAAFGIADSCRDIPFAPGSASRLPRLRHFNGRERVQGRQGTCRNRGLSISS